MRQSEWRAMRALTLERGHLAPRTSGMRVPARGKMPALQVVASARVRRYHGQEPVPTKALLALAYAAPFPRLT